MVEPTHKIRDVAWSDLFPWLMLVRCVRIALMARVILLGTLGIIATILGWFLLGEVFSLGDDPLFDAWHNVAKFFANDDFWADVSNYTAYEVIGSATQHLLQAPIAIWQFLTTPFVEMFHGGRTSTGFVFLLLCGVWELLVWGLIGGAITRIAALKFTRDEAPGPIAALTHAMRKLPSYSLPPLVALLWAAVFGVQLVIVGLAMRIDFLALLAGILWPLVIFLGLLMAILLLGLLAGWPLMWATISVEGTDSFDALSRSFAYTYHRPLRLLWYVLFATFLAIISMFVVKLFAASAVALGDWSVDWGLDEPTMNVVVSQNIDRSDSLPVAPTIDAPTAPPVDTGIEDAAPPVEPVREMTATLRGARRAISFWKRMVQAIAAGYQAGFLWVAAVGVYLLMRRDIDGVQLNEVYVDPADEYGLPPLVDEATGGVPEVAPNQPATPGNRDTI